jgi:hypothetical protein
MRGGMADGQTNATLPVNCPKCDQDAAKLCISSYTVIAVKCLSCAHTRAIEVAALPPHIRRPLPRVQPQSAT